LATIRLSMFKLCPSGENPILFGKSSWILAVNWHEI
jgi:hypothetical protein